MKTPKDGELITVGKLAEDLAKFEEEFSSTYVVCWTPYDYPCYPSCVELDEDGDLCIALKYNIDHRYTVGELLEKLGEYDDDTRVYVKGHGLYLSIVSNMAAGEDDVIFHEGEDEDFEWDIIACTGNIIGEYEIDRPVPLRPVNATVGQLVADLQIIAKKHPRCKEWYGDGGQGAPCIGTINDAGLIILLMVDECGSKHLTVNHLIAELQEYDPSLPVVMKFDYYLCNIDSRDGHFVTYDDKLEACFYDYEGTDVRIPTEVQIRANNAQQYIDLGLSVKWATQNLGASSIEEYGDYYAWGEVKTKKSFEDENYRFGQKEPYKKYQPVKQVLVKHWFRANETKTVGDGLTALLPEDDVVQATLGGGWRMPTDFEAQELIDSCNWTWVNLHDEYGYIVQSKVPEYSDRWIFLPATGFKVENGKVVAPKVQGTYLTSKIDPKDPFFAMTIGFPHESDSRVGLRDHIRCEVRGCSRKAGHSIRPVFCKN